MFKKKVFSFPFLVSFFLLVFFSSCFAQGANVPESDQQISEFSLSGYGEKGKKDWDLSGKSADIVREIVKMKEVEGNLYGQEEDIKLTADQGDFNKADGKVHLRDNVVVTTSSGAKLTTDSLDWDRKAQTVTTDDDVNIERQNMVTVARGVRGEPNLKKIALEKDVRVDINPSRASRDEEQLKALASKEKITITCDGPLEINYEKNIATFNNNVKVERADSLIYSDKMEVFFVASKGADKSRQPQVNSIDKIIASGNVKIVRGSNTSYSEEAVYTTLDSKITLTGRPKLIIYSAEDFKNASIGN
ncbi:MAG: LPS export ABC transporter periplasmic protein LptC [Omnitrophica WOR_2 bacterium RBG_13_44_8b]|nr:MAG: LPS export ABC transporter periplasmic protein LptC [Omnitrophica WOR_2 bacterium RBG_13_44_8b]